MPDEPTENGQTQETRGRRPASLLASRCRSARTSSVTWRRWPSHGSARTSRKANRRTDLPAHVGLLPRWGDEDEALSRSVSRRKGLALLGDDCLACVSAMRPYDLVESRDGCCIPRLERVGTFGHDGLLAVRASGAGTPTEQPGTAGLLILLPQLSTTTRQRYRGPWARPCAAGVHHMRAAANYDRSHASETSATTRGISRTTDVRPAPERSSPGGEVAGEAGRENDGADGKDCPPSLPDDDGTGRSDSVTVRHLLARGKAERRTSAANISRPSSRWLYRQTYSFTYPCSHLGETA